MANEIGADRLGAAADDCYERLLDAHSGLSDEESAALNARLVLVLMNAVGDPMVIEDAINLARHNRAVEGNLTASA